MKIGIITSWNDTLTLFKFLQRYDHEYIIYYDFLNRSYGNKPFEYSIEQIKKWIWLLIEKWCEKIILPPIYELALLHENSKNLSFYDSIIPLFETYLHKYCFTHSLVGKIWIFGDYADIQMAQKVIHQEAKTYTLTTHQKNIAKFSFPFNYRNKETPLRKEYLNTISYSDPIVNRTIKYDLRYFKDAGIDTAVPLNYWYFNYQHTIWKFFNPKKTRFHKLEKLEEIFNTLSLTHSTKYAVSVFYTGHCDFLKRYKKLLRLLQRWKNSEVKFEKA